MQAPTVHAAAFQAHKVQPRQIGAVAEHGAEGHHVGFHAGRAADHGAAADAHELVQRAGAADDGIVADRDVAAHHHIVGDHHVVAQRTVMGDVHDGHQQAIGADAGDAIAGDGSAMDSAVLTDLRAGADDGFGGLAFVFQILWRHTDGDEGVDHGTFADHGMAIHYDMADQLHAGFQHCVGANAAPRADDGAGRHLGAGGDDGGGVDIAGGQGLVIQKHCSVVHGQEVPIRQRRQRRRGERARQIR